MLAVTTAGGSDGASDDRVRQTQALLLRLGRERFGPPPHGVDARIRGIKDLPRLEGLAMRVLQARSWEALLSVKSQS